MTELKTRGEKQFTIFAEVIILLLVLISVAPLILITIASFTKETELIANGYSFFPKALSLDAYKYIAAESTTIFKF